VFESTCPHGAEQLQEGITEVRLTKVAGEECQSGRDCPTVYKTDRGTVAIQGYVVTDELGRSIPAGEAIVEIPVDLLKRGARVVRG
jgi:hypothetical protein